MHMATAFIVLPEAAVAFPLSGTPRAYSRDGARYSPPFEDGDETRGRSENRWVRSESRNMPAARQEGGDGRSNNASWEGSDSSGYRAGAPRRRGGGGGGRGGGRSTGRGDRDRDRGELDDRPKWQTEDRAPPQWRVEATELDAEFVYGVNSVQAALRHGRRKVHKLLLQDSMDLAKRKDRSAVTEIEELAAAAGVAIERTDKHLLNLMCDNRPHQGLAIMCSSLEFKPMQKLPPVNAAATEGGAAPLWLALDEVTDPQNLGALLRSAFFLGAHGVLVSAKNSGAHVVVHVVGAGTSWRALVDLARACVRA